MKMNGNIQLRKIQNVAIFLLIVIISFKAKADKYKIVIEPYLENQPASVGELQYKCILLKTKYKLSQKKIDEIKRLYREICNKEPEWRAYASCLYGAFQINSLSPLADKSEGAALLLNALEMNNNLPNNIEAYYDWIMAKAYLKGLGVNEDERKAFEMFEKAYELEPNSFNSDLALCYMLGIGTEVNYEVADIFFAQIYNSDNDFWRKNNCMEKIYGKYFDEDKGTNDTTLQLYYAGLKEEYKGNTDKAIELLQMAAEQNHAPSMYELALINANSGNKKEMYAMYKKAMALGYQPAEFQYSYTLTTRGAYSQTTEYPTIAALAGKNYQPAKDLLKLYESGYYTNTYQNEDIAGMLALQSIANRNTGTASSQAYGSNAGVQRNGNSNNNISSSSGNSTSITRKSSNEYAYVKTVPGILDSAKPEIVNVYIYKNSIGTYRASNIFSSNGLDLAATFPINNNGRIIGDKYYGHYYSSYGLCTYFNY